MRGVSSFRRRPRWGPAAASRVAKVFYANTFATRLWPRCRALVVVSGLCSMPTQIRHHDGAARGLRGGERLPTPSMMQFCWRADEHGHAFATARRALYAASARRNASTASTRR